VSALEAVGLGATVWAALVVGLSLSVFRPTVRPTYRELTLREQLRSLDVRGAK